MKSLDAEALLADLDTVALGVPTWTPEQRTAYERASRQLRAYEKAYDQWLREPKVNLVNGNYIVDADGKQWMAQA
jgi:hypothetical protein